MSNFRNRLWSTEELFRYEIWLLSFAVILLFGLVTWRIWIKSDFPYHIEQAVAYSHSGYVSLPHFLYHQLTVIIRAVIPFSYFSLFGSRFNKVVIENSYEIAGWLVAVIAYLLLAQLIFNEFLARTQKSPNSFLRFVGISFVLALLLVAPTNLFTIDERRLYLGYIGINVYHNPTIILLKPLALTLFWLITSPTDTRKRGMSILGAAFLTVISTLAKPSYTICLLPALFIWVGIKFIKKQSIDWRFLSLGVFIPALGILSIQYLTVYSGGESAGILFAPFNAMLLFDVSIPGISIKFFLSVLFPLTVVILFPRLVVSDERLTIAWIAFIIGAIFTYFFTETGELAVHGNFLWSGQITLFILFVQTSFFLLDHFQRIGLHEVARDPRFAVIVAVFGLHLFSGLLWYVAEVVQPHQWWGKGFNY